MDLRHLRYFLEIVEQGSLSRAAERLHVAQPALSIHLKNMEQDLGTELLLRQRGGVTPTEAGSLLARHARSVLQEHSRAMDEIRSLGQEPSGEVRLGLPGAISEIVTVPLIEAARGKYPQIRLTVSEAMSGFVATWLRDGLIDLAILYGDSKEPGIRTTKLLEEELVLIGAPQELRENMPFPELGSQKALILPSRAHGLRQMLDQTAKRKGSALEAAIEIDSYRNIKALVMRRLGVSILPVHAVSAELEAGLLVQQRFSSEGLWRSVGIVHNTKRPLTRATRCILTLLSDLAIDLAASGQWAGTKRT